jgi:hypothetical protein
MHVLPNAPSTVAAQCCLLVVAPGLVRWTVVPVALVLVAWWAGLVLVAVSGRWSQECDLLALQVVLQVGLQCALQVLLQVVLQLQLYCPLPTAGLPRLLVALGLLVLLLLLLVPPVLLPGPVVVGGWCGPGLVHLQALACTSPPTIGTVQLQPAACLQQQLASVGCCVAAGVAVLASPWSGCFAVPPGFAGSVSPSCLPWL